MVVEDFIKNRPPHLAQPFLINNWTLHEPGSYFVIIEKLPVSVGNDLCWAFEVLFAVFFVYNLSYPPLLDQWYHFIEDVAFGIAKKSAPTIENVVSQILFPKLCYVKVVSQTLLRKSCFPNLQSFDFELLLGIRNTESDISYFIFLLFNLSINGYRCSRTPKINPII